MKIKFTIPAIGLLILLISGCGEDRFTIVPVSGAVTLNGEPLQDAFVTFDPRSTEDDGIAGPGSYGRTDSHGRFTLTTYDEREGAVLADHRVAIRTMLTKEESDGSLKIVRQELLPDAYHRRSSLMFTVEEGGSDQANFELTITGKKRKR